MLPSMIFWAWTQNRSFSMYRIPSAPAVRARAGKTERTDSRMEKAEKTEERKRIPIQRCGGHFRSIRRPGMPRTRQPETWWTRRRAMCSPRKILVRRGLAAKTEACLETRMIKTRFNSPSGVPFAAGRMKKQEKENNRIKSIIDCSNTFLRGHAIHVIQT